MQVQCNIKNPEEILKAYGINVPKLDIRKTVSNILCASLPEEIDNYIIQAIKKDSNV